MKKYILALILILNSLAFSCYAESNLLSGIESSATFAVEFMSNCISAAPTESSQCMARCNAFATGAEAISACQFIGQSFQSCWVQALSPGYDPDLPAAWQGGRAEYLPKPSVQYCLDFSVSQW